MTLATFFTHFILNPQKINIASARNADFIVSGDEPIAVLTHPPSGLGCWTPEGDYIQQML